MPSARSADLIHAYFEYQSTQSPALEWAWEAVDVGGFDDPDAKWQQLVALVDAAPDEWQLGLLAAGPLEMFCRMYGRGYESIIQAAVAENNRLGDAMALAWIDLDQPRAGSARSAGGPTPPTPSPGTDTATRDHGGRWRHGVEDEVSPAERDRAVRNALAWDELLCAASLAESRAVMEVLEVPEYEHLVSEAAAYASRPPGTEPEIGANVDRARHGIEAAAGSDVLHALDEWVIEEYVYFQDPMVHYLDAIERWNDTDFEGPSLDAYDIPSWVRQRMSQDFPRDRWRRLADGFIAQAPADRTVDWESIGMSIRSTLERRVFRALWRDMAARLTATQLVRYRDWAAAALGDSGSSSIPELPEPDGSFAGHLT